jgi:PAS domain S-box-containing protein
MKAKSDITKKPRKVAKTAIGNKSIEKLKQQEQRYKEAEKIGRMGSWERDLETNELLWSDELFRIYGLKPQERPVTTEFFIDHLVHPDDKKMVRQHIKMIYKEHRDTPLEYRIVTPKGERMVFSKPQITFSGKKVTAIHGIVQDITIQKKAEQEINKLKLLQQNQLLNAIFQTQEAERIRIGEALHNGVGQLLYAIKLKLEALNRKEDEEAVSAINNILQEAISETRNISFDLVPTVLKDFGLETALRDLIARNDPGRIDLKFTLSGNKKRFSEDLEVGIYRVVQELLNNLIRHSNAEKATLALKFRPGYLSLQLKDNGIGFDVDKVLSKGKGFGLRNIRSRIQLFNGELKITSDKNKGTTISIMLPLSK